MRLDPTVNRLKFDHELAGLRDRRDMLESRGILLLSSTSYPVLEFSSCLDTF